MPIRDMFPVDASGAGLLNQSVPAAWCEGLNQNLTAIQQGFQQEDEEGYESLIQRLRAWTWCHKTPSGHADYASMETIADIANQVRSKAKVFITVGIGGSDLGSRTLHDFLNHPYHNDMVNAGKIQGAPEVYFTGDTFDPLRLKGLLDVLKERGLLDKTVVNIVSKSGTTAETALAGMMLADALGDDWMSRTVATTGLNDKSLLFQMQSSGKGKFMALLPVPDGVGGRFSFASPVGLLFLAVSANGDPLERLNQAMKGYGAAHQTFLTAPIEKNPAFRLAEFLHLAEWGCKKTSMVFYPYFDNAKLGDWFVQLYEESVQERGEGLNVIATTGPTGNHSLLNGVINGPHDKVVLFLMPKLFGEDLAIPETAPLQGSLSVFRGKTLQQAQIASMRGTYEDFVDKGVPSVILEFPKRETYDAFALMRVLMDMTAVKGRLQSLHLDPISGERRVKDEETYIQTGVEGYKQRMRDNINR
ncbi:MAG: hypothetical protein P9L94_09655 [Candidatus Hinthialibacter antarcticus]|nr:hypothetical protein [Candidatus Hinthialibacter antarcticus]